MFSKKIMNNLSGASFIRAMFEEGERLRKIHGADNVFDFSLGNPDLEPPEETKEVLRKLVMEDKPNLHKYMNNAGYPDVREKISKHVEKESGIPMTFENIVMTCGAAGGLNVVLKTLLNPDEEVILLAPYFVEYGSYIDNHGGKPVVVNTDFNTFQPDLKALEAAITPMTKAIIINSPNNPTGVVYNEEVLSNMSKMLENKEKELGIQIYIISDEPYTKLVYDGIKLPSILKIFKNAIIVNSYSKSLSLPGERIGYIAASSRIDEIGMLMNGLTYCNRTLGYVNAPSIFQKVIADSLDATVATEDYKNRRDVLYTHLTKIGFTCVKPEGAFYLFPKSPIADDLEFTKRAVKYNLLLVPGSGFKCPGYFRIAYCASMQTIQNSLPAFEALAKEFFT